MSIAGQPSISAASPLGWIGTGIMGLSMCSHLLSKGYTVTVYNRTKSRAQPLLDKGARWADSPQAVAAESQVTFTIVGYPADVRSVYLARTAFSLAPSLEASSWI